MAMAMLNWTIVQGRMTSHILDLNLDIGRRAGSSCRMTHTFAGTFAKRREVAGKILPAVVFTELRYNLFYTAHFKQPPQVASIHW